MIRTLSASSPDAGAFEHLASEKKHLQEAVKPLLDRIPVKDRALLEGSSDP
jgi:hypothetical protein